MVTSRKGTKRKRKPGAAPLQSGTAQAARPKQAIMVLGMHRSGTSALTRVLSLLGADLPKNVIGPGVGNDTGHWESTDLVVIHDEMLEAAGTAWYDWRAINPDWIDSAAAEAFKQRLVAVLRQDYANSAMFTVKDPRICRFVPLWRRALKEFNAAPVPILPIRSPLEVAASLRRRDGFALTKSYLLWLRHVLDAERETRDLPRAIVTYDMLMDDWRALVARISERTGLRWPRRSDRSELEIDRFLTDAHRHHTTDDAQLQARADVADWVKQAYAVFCDMNRNTEAADHHRQLDRISAEFNKAAAAFGLLIARETADAETRLRNAQARSQAAFGERDAAHAALADRESALAAATGALEVAQQQVAEHAARLRALDDELVATRGRAHEAEAGAAARQQEVGRLQQELEAARNLLRESQTEAQRLGGDFAQAAERLREAQARIDALTGERDAARDELAAREAELCETRALLHDIEQQAGTAAEELEAKGAELALAEIRARENETRAEARQRDIDLLSRTLETNRHLLQASQSEVQRLRKETEQAEQRHRDAEAQISVIVGENQKALAAAREEQERTRRELSVTQSILRDARRENELIDAALKQARQSLQENDQHHSRLAQELASATTAATKAAADIRELQAAQDRLRPAADDAEQAKRELTRLRDTAQQTQLQLQRDIAARDARAAELQRDLDSLRTETEALRAKQQAEERQRLEQTLARPRGLSWTRLWRRPASARQRREMDAIRSSGLFNPLWYLERYPDVAAAGQDPLMHYVLHGGAEGRDPHPLFDGKWYLEQYPDGAGRGLSPLGHYVLEGAAKGHDPNPLFDTDWYLQQYLDVAASGLIPLQHFWTIGAAQGFDPNPMFDTSWYLEQNRDVKETGENALLHYIVYGRNEGRKGHPDLYLDANRNADRPTTAINDTHKVLAAQQNLAADAPSNINLFAQERLSSEQIVYESTNYEDSKAIIGQSDWFDRVFYLTNNPDVAADGVDPLQHYVQYGWKEGRNPHPNFDPRWYLERYPDVKASGNEPLEHFIRYGASEGRHPSRPAHPLAGKLPLTDAQLLQQKSHLGISLPLAPRSITLGIVTYNNSPRELSTCLTSAKIALQNLNGAVSQQRILIIDNGNSTNLSSFWNDSETIILPSRGNIGFAAAHNLMMKQSFAGGTDYYIAVNPDGVFHPGCITALFQMSQAANDRAIVEALQFPDEHPKIYDPVDFSTPWASGACMLITKAVYSTIGGFDETFFMYCEDVDISWRARAYGFEVKSSPNSIFFHSVVDRVFDAQIHKRFIRSGIILARKWGGHEIEKKLLDQAAVYNVDTRSIPFVEPILHQEVANFDHAFSFSKTRW